MPLLKRKAFEKSSASGYLRDDDEVFHCEITDEIFKDYEEYCERIILVNSMVWSCEMTGKNNLTYAEALESEKAARKSLRDFPMELRIPILYLATKTNRSSFAEMSEDVFNYVRERYFVGETVEACLEGDIWQEAHILSVTSQKQHPDNKAMVPASAYCYEVEQYEETDATAAGQIGTAPYERIRRRKGIYSRDKNRLFLKQFVEMGPVIKIKASAIQKYNINKVHFDQIFTGSPPVFPSSKKLLMSPSTSKVQTKPGSASKLNKSMRSPQKGRQESMDKFVKKTDKSDVNKTKTVNPEAKKSAQELADKMRRAEEQHRLRKEEEKAMKKEKTARVLAYMKEWQKVKDDLELEDHKVLPKGTPVVIEGIEPKHIGDFLSVLDFVHTYSEVLKTKDVFHNELDWETFRKVLTVKESAGLFSDLIQMFLSAIFSLQEDEAEEYNEKGGIQESTGDKDQNETEMGINRAIELATRAGKWAQTYLGTPLSKLPLDPSTVSEVLRLHLLSSGGAAGGRCVAWRYHQRGGYSSPDDPGLRLRLRRPRLLARLTRRHAADLPLDDKFAILQCLMNQVMSYATVRDMIEDKLEEYKNLKQAYRMLQINERKREPQLATARMELRREAVAKKEQQKLTGDEARKVDEELKLEIEKITKESEQKKIEYEKKSKELQMQLFEFTNYLGMDRAFHRYWVSRRVAGLFVEAGSEWRGSCRHKPVPLPARSQADSADLLTYVTELYQSGAREKEGSDKENESGSNSRGNSPKKPLAHMNGVNSKVLSPDSIQHMRELMVCTADANTCYVHGKSERPQWWVYTNEAQVDALIAALNKRGVREAELRHNLEMERASLVDYLHKCPFAVNGTTRAQNGPLNPPATRRRAIRPSLVVPPDCSLEEALELALRDHILELEEKIHHGCLGALKVKDREAWRGTIMLRSYDKQAEYLCWGPNKAFRDDTHLPDGKLQIPNGTEEADTKEIPENKYRDPVYYLETPKPNGIKLEPSDSLEMKSDVVRGLASALLQVSQGIHHKYIKRPLGLDDKERKDREARNKSCDLDALERWEVSLMESRSIAALTLHLFVLDASVCWAASVLHASCKLCRRRTDPDNMLLCDGCNKGHHLYCLKPQLTKVPDGDWFCDQCKPKEKTPRKRRKLYTEEEEEEEEEEEAEDSEAELSLGVCATCGSGGELGATCARCGGRYHAECARPALARAARRWTCAGCLAPPHAREPASRRRCATAAMSSIQRYARTIHRGSDSTDSEDSESNTALVKLKSRRSRGSHEPSPLPNGNSKRSRKSKELNGSLNKRGKASLTNGDHDDSSSKKRRGRHEVRLHREELDQLLRDAMKHKDSWPFYEPVSTTDVPDYLDVITTPMDLSTVKHKLDSSQYERDEEMLSDVGLVFHNCYTYNQESHPVAKAGYRLEKYIIKRCRDLNLPPLPESNPTDDEDDVPLKRSLPESDETPRAKKAKLL